tara:strand:+ start:60 stop:479 length:420 start_codon:yes stop_codon:yes gene_type:complete
MGNLITKDTNLIHNSVESNHQGKPTLELNLDNLPEEFLNLNVEIMINSKSETHCIRNLINRLKILETDNSRNKSSIEYMMSVIHNYYNIYEKTITEKLTPLNTTKIAYRLGMVEQEQVDTMTDFSEGKIDYATMRGICG